MTCAQTSLTNLKMGWRWAHTAQAVQLLHSERVHIDLDCIYYLFGSRLQQYEEYIASCYFEAQFSLKSQ